MHVTQWQCFMQFVEQHFTNICTTFYFLSSRFNNYMKNKFGIISLDRRLPLLLLVRAILNLALNKKFSGNTHSRFNTELVYEHLKNLLFTCKSFDMNQRHKCHHCYQFRCSPSQPVCHFLGVYCSLVQCKLTSHLFHDVIFKFNFLHELSLNLFSQSCDFILL